MRQTISCLLVLAMTLLPVGCTDASAQGSVTVGDTTVSGSISIKHHKAIQQSAIVDANNTASSGTSTVLVDVPPGFVYNSANPPQSVVTITTDTGMTFSQSFALVPSSSAGFSPAASGTQTLAFVAQNPSAVAAFVQSATSHASSTVNVDVQSTIAMQGPTDGGTYTIYGRDYSSSTGLQGDGSASYIAPTSGGGGTCTGGRCPNLC